MKKITLLLGLALLSLSCSTENNDFEENNAIRSSLSTQSVTPVSKVQAKETAINFSMSIRNNSRNNGVPYVTESTIEEIQTVENENSIPVMYAVNIKNNQGFVVVSASLAEKPILAYSNEGKFDFNIIDEYNGVADWAITKYLKINGLINNGSFPNTQTANQWNSINPSHGIGFVNNNGEIVPWIPPTVVDEWDEIETYGPNLTTNWAQSLDDIVIGYNNFVRFNNCTSGTAPAGCVAVAMGQIMKYYNWPNIYNINTMSNTVTYGNFNSPTSYDVAHFLDDIGDKVNMTYSCTLSTAHSSNANNAFINHYSYTTSGNTYLNFIPLINNLKSNKPVYLDGCRTKEIKSRPKKLGIFGWSIGKTTYSYKDCHAWVADGFEEINRTTVYDNNFSSTYPIVKHIHMNWGWGNNGWNGWYDYESWDDVNNGNDTYTVDYIYQQGMIHNITPQ